jgi:predicted ATPase/DNA-binding SARP family transcriptional activator
VEVRLLGPIDVVVDGEPVSLASPRRQALLAALALRPGEAVPADRLVEEVWDGAPPDNGLATLHAHVSHLRRQLPGVIATRRPFGYVLGLDSEAVDAIRFESLVLAARRARPEGRLADARRALDEALGLWRGPALGELASLAFAAPAATRLEELRRSAEEELVDVRLALGDHAELVAVAADLARAEPLRERRTAQLMVALYRAGRQAEALRAFQELRDRLTEELGIEPGRDVRRLEEAVLLQAVELDWRPPADPGAISSAAHLGLPATSFVGRDDEMTALADAVAHHRLVTLTGQAGCGKTRLALELAARRAGPVWVVEIAGSTGDAEVWHRVGAAVGATQRPAQSLADAVAEAVAAGGLLILDGCERATGPTAAVATEVLAHTSGVSVVVTSQQPLGVPGEHVIALAPLGIEAAVDLFVDRARAARSVEPSGSSRAAFGRACARLGGLPLAIELAAARLVVLAPEQLADRLDDALGLLDGLRGALDGNHDLLDDEAAMLFRRLAPFPAGLSLDEVEGLAAGSGPSSVVDLLDRLRRASLVTIVERPDGPIRFRLLEPVRQLAAEKLADAGEVDAVMSAALARVSAAPAQSAADYPDNIRVILGWALGGRDHATTVTGVTLVATLAPVWLQRGQLSEGRHWTEAALKACTHAEVDARIRAAVRLGAGSLSYHAGDADAANVHLAAALDLAQGVGDERVAARARFNLANIAHVRGADARDEFAASAAVARSLGDNDLLMRVLNSLGVASRRHGEPDAAQAAFEEALDVARGIGDPMAVVSTLVNLGEVRNVRGAVDDARARFTEALIAARDANFARGIASATGGLGALAEDPAEAVALLEESAAAARAGGDLPTLAVTLVNLGQARHRTGDSIGGRAELETARAAAERLGDARTVAHADHLLAVVARRLGDHKGAARRIASALAERIRMGQLDRVVESLELAGGLALDSGDASRAVVLLSAAAAARHDRELVSDAFDAAESGADLAQARTALGSDAFDAARAAGRQLDLHAAAALVTQP